MRIQVLDRLRPFSHNPGAACLLPGSHLQIQVFPTLIRLYDLGGGKSSHLLTEIEIDLVGPVQDFTVLLDMEKGALCVWGTSPKGYFRYQMHALMDQKGVVLEVQKVPEGGLGIKMSPPYHAYKYLHDLFITHEGLCQPKELLFITQHGQDIHDRTVYQPMKSERLSLGNHKAQDWDMVKRRCDLKEIFPAWLQLAKFVTHREKVENRIGIFHLLDECRNIMENREKEQIYQAFSNLFLAGFHHLLVPRLFDDDHQGILKSRNGSSEEMPVSPIAFLCESAALIKTLFISHEEDHIHVLPFLPPEFHSGRFIDLTVAGMSIDFEWSKKSIRRMIIRAHESKTLFLGFQKHVRNFRFKQQGENKGTVMKVGGAIPVEAGKTYFLDRFEK
jgi:hypothetical protein